MADDPYQRAVVSTGPRRFLPLDVNIDRTPPPAQSIWGNLADSYAGKFWGATKDAVDRIIARQRGGNAGDPNYDPLSNIPKGYEDFADAYMYAWNQSEVDQITRNIDENRAIRGRQAQLSGTENLLYGVISGIFDPINLVGVELKGLSFLQGAAKGGAVYGGINAAQEVFLNTMDPTVSDLETATNVGFGFLLGGVISGAAAHFSGGGAGRLADDVRAKADEVGNRYAETFARMEGNPLTEVIDFNGQGVKIVEGNTGKYDKNGNYVTAFFRPKEAFEAAARQEQVAKAVDDALGDVIPDGDTPIPVLDEALDGLIAKIESALPNQQNGTVKAALEPDEVALLRARGVAVDENGSLSVTDAKGMVDQAKAGDSMGKTDPEDTIFVDSAAVMARFKEKPWANPRYEGIEAFADDAFETPQEWLNFTILHELNHKTTKRLPNESQVAYENRINRMAYDEMKAGRLPLSPTDGALEKLMLLPTPAGELMRLAPRNRAVHDLAQGIAGDHATLTVANRVYKATTPGGSVFQRAQRWLYANYIVGKSWRTAYAEYLTGKAPKTAFGTGVEVLHGALPVVGARSKGKLTPAEFRAYVGRATNSDTPFAMFGKALSDEDMVLVRKAAADTREVLREFEVKARELGMFDAQKRLEREIAWRKRVNTKDEGRLARFKGKPAIAKEIEEAIAKRTAEIEDLRGSLDELSADPITPPKEQHYFPRVFDVGRIKDQYDTFVAKIADAYGGDEGALGRAKATVDRIIGEGGEDFLPGAGTPKNLKSRQIPLTNEELADWLVWDVETIVGMYSRRMGASLEMTNKYGSRMLDEQLDDLNGALIDQGVDLKTRRKIIAVQEDLRDKVLGRFHGKDPMSWDNRAARAIKNYASITLLGEAIYSQTMDLFRTIATEGFAPVGKALYAAARGELKDLAKGAYAKQAGEALEMTNASWMARMIESDSAIAVTNQAALERGLAAAQSPFFTLNLMNPMTTIWKDFTSTMSAHMLIDEAVKVAAAVRSGKTAATFSKQEAKLAAHLASWGIDLRGAQLIADMPFEKTEATGLYLANMEAWSGRDGERARELMLGAISGTVRSSVVSPGPMQRPAIMDGVFRWKGERKEAPLASLPFQLLSFTLSSSSKLTHSLLSGRDRNVAASLGILMAGGMFTTWLKSDNFEQMDWDEFMLASFENSSIAGYLTDVYKRAETLTGYGPRSAMGMYQFGENQVNDEIGAVAGPGVGSLAGAMEAFVNPELNDRQRAGLVLRAIPFAGLLYWSDTLKQWSKDLADAGLMPEPVGIGNSLPVFDDEPVEVVMEDAP